MKTDKLDRTISDAVFTLERVADEFARRILSIRLEATTDQILERLALSLSNLDSKGESHDA